MEPLSATKGFFQQTPLLKNQIHEDVSVQRVLKCMKDTSTPTFNTFEIS